MCIGGRDDAIIYRIDPGMYETILERNGCRPMVHGKQVKKGFMFVSEEGDKRDEDFNY